MNNFSYLHDTSFLRQLDNERLKTTYTKIIILNKEELPLETIQGRVSNGSLNVNGSSSVRRTGSITFLAEEKNNNLENINNILSMNKKIKILIGFDNNINSSYDKIIWFPLGVFVITQPSITHNTGGVNITLNFKDKMCLLNGECGGALPTSITFDKTWSIYEIIQTLVHNFGGEPLNKIFINDIELEIKQIVTWMGAQTLYYNTNTSRYTTDASLVNGSEWISFESHEEIGYVYELFSYPQEGGLVTGIGDSVTSVLDKIKSIFSNYEYFYDVEGNFIFQEMKNYLNNSYDPTDAYRLDNERRVEIPENNSLAILKDTNYKVDFNNSSKNVYIFDEGSGLINSYSNTPNYMNIKNDFHIWGKDYNDNAIHYHLAIKNKPTNFHTYAVVFNEDGGLRLASAEELASSSYVIDENFIISNDDANFAYDKLDYQNTEKGSVSLETFSITEKNDAVGYTPADWRAELYLQGLAKWQNGIRPDVYEQELIDNFDSIYNFKEKKFKNDIVKYPNALKYFIDYLEPADELHNYSVDNLGNKLYVYQQDTVVRLYDTDIPNVILLDVGLPEEERQSYEERCRYEGQPYSNVETFIMDDVQVGAAGDSAANAARSLLYQYTNYNESITIQSIPIYYLEANTRITVNDMASNIYGDYIISSFSLPLNGAGTMSISAKRALERI